MRTKTSFSLLVVLASMSQVLSLPVPTSDIIHITDPDIALPFLWILPDTITFQENDNEDQTKYDEDETDDFESGRKYDEEEWKYYEYETNEDENKIRYDEEIKYFGAETDNDDNERKYYEEEIKYDEDENKYDEDETNEDENKMKYDKNEIKYDEDYTDDDDNEIKYYDHELKYDYEDEAIDDEDEQIYDEDEISMLLETLFTPGTKNTIKNIRRKRGSKGHHQQQANQNQDDNYNTDFDYGDDYTEIEIIEVFEGNGKRVFVDNIPDNYSPNSRTKRDMTN